MKTIFVRAMAFSVALAAFPPTVSAQTGTAGNQSAIAGLAAGVNVLAADLEKNIKEVRAALNDAASSREDGLRVFNQLQASVERVHVALAEDSDIWVELTRAMDAWDEIRQDMLKKSATNPTFDAIAEEWSVRLKQASTLRKQILEQRAESVAMLDQLLSQRDVVLAYYELGQADRALEQMQMVSDDLGTMSEKIRAINEQAQLVAEPAISQ